MPFDFVLQEIRQKIRLEEYVMTIHADEEMDDDLNLGDLETCILTGEILEPSSNLMVVVQH